MISTRATARAVSLILLGSHSAGAQTPRFDGIGVLPGDTFSEVFGLSRDGSTAVGESGTSTTNRAFRWTASGGLQAFGVPPTYDSDAWATSASGSVTVGNAASAVAWYDPSMSTPLPWLPGGRGTLAHSVSADGRAISGICAVNGWRAVRWVNGVPQDLGAAAGATSFTGISDDGNVVVGGTTNVAHQDHAFRWTQETGMVDLGTLPGGDSSGANAANANGSVVVGNSSTATGSLRAFRWTTALGMQDLGALPGGEISEAFAVTPDGNTVGGDSRVAGSAHAFLWTVAGGMRDLNTVLPALGLDLTGWTLIEVRGISADGLTLAGIGRHQLPDGARLEGWVATIPAPSAVGSFCLPLLWGLSRRRRMR